MLYQVTTEVSNYNNYDNDNNNCSNHFNNKNNNSFGDTSCRSTNNNKELLSMKLVTIVGVKLMIEE